MWKWYQNILLDNLDVPINITFSTASPLNSLVTKPNTSFTADDSHIKKIEDYITEKYDVKRMTSRDNHYRIFF